MIIKKHFKDRLKERFGVGLNEVFNIDNCLVWNQRNVDYCKNLMIRTKLVDKNRFNPFYVENFKLDLVVCGHIDRDGLVFVNTVIPRVNL